MIKEKGKQKKWLKSKQVIQKIYVHVYMMIQNISPKVKQTKTTAAMKKVQ